MQEEKSADVSTSAKPQEASNDNIPYTVTSAAKRRELFAAARVAANKNQNRNACIRRIASQMWDMDSFDPFQLFKVIHRTCNVLQVHVIRGVDITKGWLRDQFDVPDPYLTLYVPGTPNGNKTTKSLANETRPVWNEHFEFYLDPSLTFQLVVLLKDANIAMDDTLGKCTISLDGIEIGKEVERAAYFDNGSKVLLKLKITEDDKPDLRYSLALSDSERHYLIQRRQKVMESMNKFLGEENGPKQPREVPVVGLIGSGGGFRAMIALSGVCQALYDEGIMDCLMYMAGLSGSTWYLSYLYSHLDFPANPPSKLQNELRDKVGETWFTSMLNSSKIASFTCDILKNNLPSSLTDVFGHLIADILLGIERKSSTLSEQQRCLIEAAAPLPMYACLNVKHDVSARVFQDWIEFSPYEIGMPKYGVFMPPQLFNSKFYMGKLIKKCPECPLHFLQGVWGNAFCDIVKGIIQGNEADDTHHNISNKSDSENVATSEAAALPEEMIRTEGVTEVETNSSEEEYELDSSDDDTTEHQICTEHDHKASGHEDCHENCPTAMRIKEKLSKANRRSFIRKRIEKHLALLGKTKDFLLRNTTSVKYRAGRIYNPLRGLNMETTFSTSPWYNPVTPTTADDDVDFKGFFEPTAVGAKKMYLVDAGLNFNLPFPVLLRPQRAVDVYLSFSFSARKSDDAPPFQDILIAETWARLNHVPFPPVEKQVAEYLKEELREMYVFRDEQDMTCPVILHFILINKEFKSFKAPGIARSTQGEKDFANFNIFYDNSPYDSTKFQYTGEEFDRLTQLMDFNVRSQVPEIKHHISEAVKRKKILASKPLPEIQTVKKLVKSLSLGKIPELGGLLQESS